MRYKAILFDLDGVLCSTDEFHYRAWKALADRLGIPFDRTRNSLLRGVGRMESLEILLKGSGLHPSEAEKAALAEEKNARYRELLSKLSPADLSDDVRNTLRALRKTELRLAVASSSKNTAFILGRLGLADFFDAAADGTMVSRAKPAPDVFCKAAELLGLPPLDCLVVEDAHAGAAAAAAGGFPCAGIGDAAADPRVQYRLERLSDLLKVVGPDAKTVP